MRGRTDARHLARVALPLAIAGWSAIGCGYRPIRGSLEGAPRIWVAAGIARTPSGASHSIVDETARGARAELARWGALANEDTAGAGRLTVEVVRLDESSEGISVDANPAGEAPILRRPAARGVRLRVTARGEVSGGGETFATPDVEASEVVAVTQADPLAWQGARAAAVRMLARRAGARVARYALGVP